MAENTVDAIERTVQKTHIWLKHLAELGHFRDQQQAYTALSAVLHSLRDRLTVDEAAHLASELPMLVRGLYYEGWKPALAPNRERTRQQFIDSVSESLRTNTEVAPDHAIRCVFALLEDKLTAGEIGDVKQMLPPEIREFWPQPAEQIR